MASYLIDASGTAEVSVDRAGLERLRGRDDFFAVLLVYFRRQGWF